MSLLKRFKKEYEFSEVILNWCKGREKFLNVVSIPYNTTNFFVDSILYLIKNRNNILYITNEEEKSIDIIQNIKRKSDFRQYSYVRKSKLDIVSNLKVTNFNVAFNMDEKFDFIIYDDLSSYANHNKDSIKDLILSKLTNEGKCIMYSIESLFINSRSIYIPFKKDRMPIIEPRTLLTRINISREIPFIIYDYMKWSFQSKRKVIIYTPSHFISKNLYNYFKNYINKIDVNVILDMELDSNKSLVNFEKMKEGIFITNLFYDGFSKLKDTDLIIYGSDKNKFNYKELIYLCGTVGRGEYDFKGEIIFLANTETVHMEKAKNIIRGFNKEAWELGFLTI
ncbi:competence protein ComF [Clostridium sporogenes]|uniref:competence protein ComF n=1 Tax=Clostridium sporogenes TaxID=1509 RepID=UPI0013D2DE39|nr:competence protein ComF [Clostridium sporogenes]NFL75773.1 competence protein ComF [Clostridium sporogenes]